MRFSILDDMYQIRNGRIYNKFQEALFEILAKGNANGKIEGHTYIHNDYSSYWEKNN